MATLTNCLQIVNAMPQQDQDALLARLDELQAQGMSPKEAQLQAAIDVLAQVEREGGIRKSADRKAPRLIEDIPNDSWLQGKIDYAISKGRNQWGVPHMSTVTGYFDKPVEVSLRVLSRLKGQRDEQNNVREDSLDYIRKNWDEASEQPPYIEVAHNGEAWVSEGNHRIMVAAEKGLESLPVEIRYFDGGQRRSGPLSPSRIPSLDPGILRSPDRPQFYSQLQRAIEGVPARLDNMGAAAWKQWLTANASKLGVKADEVEWSGIKDYLDLQGKKKLSKDELSSYLDDSGVKVSEVMLGAPELTEDGLPVGYEIIDEGDGKWSFSSPSMASKWFKSRDEAVAAAKRDAEMELENGEMSVGRPKYAQYTLPGGENYRELLITMPGGVSGKELAALDERIQELEDDRDGAEYDERDEIDERIAAVQAERKALLGKGYRSSHWDEPNVLTHIRVNDRTDADGKRVLFVEEVQSDWGQDGKKKGFKATPAERAKTESRIAELTKQIQAIRDSGVKYPADGTPVSEIDPKFVELQKLIEQRVGLQSAALSEGNLPPSAPFIGKTEGWLNLALKRIAMMAVEGGYDKVAFISGEQSADRYSLRKQVESVTATKKAGGRYTLLVETKNGQDNSFPNLDPQGMEDTVGKEMAQKILDATSGDKRSARFSGLDLEVGGEGMKAFYDQIVPQAVSKLLPKIGGEKLGAVAMGEAAKHRAIQADADGGGEVVTADGETISFHDTAEEARAEARRLNGGVLGSTALEQPGFDVTDKMRETVGQGLPLFSKDREGSGARKPWFEDLSKLKVSTNYQLGDLLKSSKKLSWWDRTVGTQYNLATKQPEFKRVFDAVQSFINDVSAYATRAADMAPTILPKLESFKDIVKQPMTPEDVVALRDPVFGGTLKYMRDEDGNVVETDDVQKAGVVFTDAELKSMFKLSDEQIGLYRQFRKSVDQSVTDLALSDMVRYLGEDGKDIAETVMASGNVDVAVGIISSHLSDLARETPSRINLLDSTRTAIELKGEQANRLMDRGYAPLSRFGQFTTYVVGKDGEQLYFGMFENERGAQKMAREMREQYPDATVSTSTMSQESYKLFSGVTPETLALFGDSLGLEESGIDTKSEVFQQYLKVAKTNRSAMKRLIERKGIDGFSEDAGRVLAGFVYSNARQISTNLHAGEIGKAAADVKDGDVKDAAIRLMEYIQNPQEEAQAIRGLLFTQFIGGSIASAMVNMTQPFTMTAPYLAQFDGITGATKRMADAMKLVSRGVRNDADLQDALKRAEDEGIVSPQEVHQLMAQARGKGSLITGDGTKAGDAAAKANNFTAKLGLAWGKAFSAAEQFNRRITFIAAYKLARDKGMENPFAFAEQTIAETQGIYNKGNKPAWARGAVGGTLFTFKQYSISYVEFLRRMWGNGPEGKKAVGLALGVLFMSAGLGGMPGADDLDDVIDGFAQRVLGKSFDSKQAKKEFFASILGQSGAEFVMGGLTGLPGAPIDLSGRLGLGNLIPGTGILTKKSDYGRDTAEIFGPAGSLFKQVATGAGKLVQGDVTGAAKEVAPVAAQNVIKGVDMAVMGMYRDTKGRKVIDVDAWEAVAKAVGFQPASVKRVQEATGTQQNLIGQNKLRETEIADKWAAGRIERNPAKVEEAKAELAEWNRKNPQSPISIDQGQINRRVQQAMMSKAQRLEKTAPKELRQSVRQELERAN